jgi:ferredoxin
MVAPNMFVLNDIDGTSTVVDDLVPADEREHVHDAARSCPEQAVVVEADTVRVDGQAPVREVDS